MPENEQTNAPEQTNTAPPPVPPGAGGLVGMFVDRPVMTSMVTLAILAIGVLALIRLPLQLAPDGLSAEASNIWIPIRQDMPPREAQDRILEPLEDLLETIPGVGDIEATASSGGVRVTVNYEGGIDPNLANAEVRDRLQRARLEWPEDIDRWFSWREDPSAAPLAFFQMQTPERNSDWDSKMDRIVTPKLEAVDGVGRVDLWGILDETIRIWFDKDKLVEHRIDYGQLLQKLARDNESKPIGELDDGTSRYVLRLDSRFGSRDEIARYPIRQGLTIGDVARVEVVPSVRDNLSRYDGKFTYGGILYSSSGKNPLEASQNVRAACDELAADPRLEGISFRFQFDQGELIKDSLSTLVKTSLQGGLLALIALFVFLRNVKTTLAIAAAIPLALLIAAGQMFFFGGSLNIASMAGLTLAVGMVVDNAVVVLDNIRRCRSLGLSRRDACVQGTREMFLAITMATLTTVVVILPIVLLSGDTNVRAVFSALGIPLSVALLGSLFVALLLMPTAVARVGSSAKKEDPSNLRGPLRWLAAINEAVVGWALKGTKHRVAVSIAMFAVFLIGLAPAFLGMLRVGLGEDGGPFQQGDVQIQLEMPRGRTLRDSVELVKEYEAYLDERREELSIDHVSVRVSRTSARFDVMLNEDIAKEQFRAQRARILAEWPRKAGVNLTLRDTGAAARGGGGGSEEGAERNFVLRLWGPDTEYLQTVALGLRDQLQAMPEVRKAELSDSRGEQEVVVQIDRDRMNELGVQPENLTASMSSGLRGQELPRFNDGDRELRLIAQFDSENNPSLLDLKETQVFTRNGSFQRVDDLSNIRFERTLEAIRRKNGRTYVSIVGERADDVDGVQMNNILKGMMTSTPLPTGYDWSDDSASRETLEQFRELGLAGLLSIVLIFLLMGVLFESVIVPGAILATLPFAIAGAITSLGVFKGSIDVMAFIGILLLCGIVVNNGIVLLDTITRFRRDGLDRRDAILQAIHVRLRPIVMTATTTVLGLLPMAMFGESTGSGLSYVGMSIAVAGGLTCCTVMTSVAVPLAYTYLDDFALWLRGMFGRARVGF
ncbi:MAG: efflux RND transporter permease subunit [Planctomycetota bacterium]